jgi:hypothetical protein
VDKANSGDWRTAECLSWEVTIMLSFDNSILPREGEGEGTENGGNKLNTGGFMPITLTTWEAENRGFR